MIESDRIKAFLIYDIAFQTMTIKGRTYINKMRYIISIIQRINVYFYYSKQTKEKYEEDKKLPCLLLRPKNIHKQIYFLLIQRNDCTRKDTNQNFIRNDEK